MKLSPTQITLLNKCEVENNKTINFWSGAMRGRKMISNNKLESGSFRASGTMVRCRIVEVQ